MTQEQAIQMAYDMGGHPYSVSGMADALMKGVEIGREEQKAIDDDHFREVTQKVIDKAIQYWDARLRELKQEIREGYDISRTKELIDFKKAMEE